jgi:hypothetical protein
MNAADDDVAGTVCLSLDGGKVEKKMAGEELDAEEAAECAAALMVGRTLCKTPMALKCFNHSPNRVSPFGHLTKMFSCRGGTFTSCFQQLTKQRRGNDGHLPELDLHSALRSFRSFTKHEVGSNGPLTKIIIRGCVPG